MLLQCKQASRSTLKLLNLKMFNACCDGKLSWRTVMTDVTVTNVVCRLWAAHLAQYHTHAHSLLSVLKLATGMKAHMHCCPPSFHCNRSAP